MRWVLCLAYLFIGLVLTAQTEYRNYNIGISESGYGILELTDGHFLIHGKEWNSQDEPFQYFFLKVDAEGNVMWLRKHIIGENGSSYSRVRVFEQKNGFLVFGTAYKAQSSESFNDIFIAELSDVGDILSKKIIGTNNIERVVDVVADGNTYLLLTISLEVPSFSGKHDLLRIDTSGNTISKSEVRGLYGSNLYSMKMDDTGHLWVTGYLNEYGVIGKLSASGLVLREQLFGGSGRNFFFDIQLDYRGQPICFGTTESNENTGYIIVGFDENARAKYKRIIHSRNAHTLYAGHPRLDVCKLEDNNFLLTVDTTLHPPQGFIKSPRIYHVDSTGILIGYRDFFRADTNDVLYLTIQSSEGKFISVGNTYHRHTSGEHDVLVIEGEIDYTTSITSPNDELRGLNIYPNPFCQSLNIDLDEGTKATELEIFELSGKLVFSRNIDKDKRCIDLSFLPNGLYSLTLRSESEAWRTIIVKSN